MSYEEAELEFIKLNPIPWVLCPTLAAAEAETTVQGAQLGDVTDDVFLLVEMFQAISR